MSKSPSPSIPSIPNNNLDIKIKSTFFKTPLSNILDQVAIDPKPEIIGLIQSVSDGIVWASGLDNICAGEIVDLGNNISGLVLNLEKSRVGIVALGNLSQIRAGTKIKRTGKLLSVGVSDSLLGHIVDSLGQPIDGSKTITALQYMPLEHPAPGVITRQSVNVPLQTGIKAIDAMIPIGRGQRQLIIGDRATGKTAIALATILNQKNQHIKCIYVCIGQKKSSLAQTIEILKKHKAMDYTIIVAATASETAAQQYLAPYTGLAIAEYFLDRGDDCLIIYDDLTKHAQAYREMSLLLRRPSGREAYPGDVFYLHSRLLERACRLNLEHGGGSITALPIIETQANDVSAYIPTNVISITDGQIYLETDLFNQGIRPAINIGLSVSRVGSTAQVKAMKQVAGTMKLDLAQLRELEAFAQFSSDLDKKTKDQLDRGLKVRAILNQGWDQPLSMPEQVAIIFAVVNGYLDHLDKDFVIAWQDKFLSHLHQHHQDFLDLIDSDKQLTDITIQKLTDIIVKFNQDHLDPDNLID